MQPPARCSNHRCVYIDQCDFIFRLNLIASMHCLVKNVFDLPHAWVDLLTSMCVVVVFLFN